MKRILAFLVFFIANASVYAQTAQVWKNKQATVVLTYDDAIDIDIDNVAPALDSLKLKATFYLIGTSPVIANRMDAWRKIAKNGHELGNHTLTHPCDGARPGRTFVKPETDLSKYTAARAVSESRVANTLLKAIDGKDKRTFAYPCGDLTINGEPFYTDLKNDFAGARGVSPGLETIDKVNLDNIKCYSINGQKAEYMINLVKQAMQTHTLVVFLFHGVGGGHSINVDKNEHSKLLHFLKQNEKDLWIAPMVDVAEHVMAYQKKQTK